MLYKRQGLHTIKPTTVTCTDMQPIEKSLQQKKYNNKRK